MLNIVPNPSSALLSLSTSARDETAPAVSAAHAAHSLLTVAEVANLRDLLRAPHELRPGGLADPGELCGKPPPVLRAYIQESVFISTGPTAAGGGDVVI